MEAKEIVQKYLEASKNSLKSLREAKPQSVDFHTNTPIAVALRSEIEVLLDVLEEIEREERAGFKSDTAADLTGIFRELDRDEERAQRHGAEQPTARGSPCVPSRGLRAMRRGPAARDQDDGIHACKT